MADNYVPECTTRQGENRTTSSWTVVGHRRKRLKPNDLDHFPQGLIFGVAQRAMLISNYEMANHA